MVTTWKTTVVMTHASGTVSAEAQRHMNRITRGGRNASYDKERSSKERAECMERNDSSAQITRPCCVKSVDCFDQNEYIQGDGYGGRNKWTICRDIIRSWNWSHMKRVLKKTRVDR